MSDTYRPFRNIETVDDLLLVRHACEGSPCLVQLPQQPYYAEICAWVNVQCPEETLFSSTEQVLLCTANEGDGDWRLVLTPHGYLRFEGTVADERVECVSPVPASAVVDAKQQFRLGVSFVSYAWLQRNTAHWSEAASYSRIRLLASPGPSAPLSEIGGISGQKIPARLAPVPRGVHVGAMADGSQPFNGQITELIAYNTSLSALFDGGAFRGAGQVLPVIPGGGAFEPRWVEERTIEAFPRPEFTQTASYWVFLRIADSTHRLRRLRVRPVWRGGTNMTPTFFWSEDGDRWRRIVPHRVWMGEDGEDFRVEFELTERMATNGFLASAPVFGEEQRLQLLRWAAEQEHTTVEQIGESVQGRPIHAIRVGMKQDGPDTKGVVVICGQHSPLEMMAAHVIEPVIRRLLWQPELLESCTFCFVPTVNVDCAHYGGNGMNANGLNTNRQWFEDIQPENAAVINYLDGLTAKGQSIEFAMDIHAGGTFKNHVLMTMGSSEVCQVGEEAQARQEQWASLLEGHAGLRQEDGWPLAQQRLRATDYFHQTHGATAFCLEMSSCSYFDPQTQRTKGFDMMAFDLLADGLVSAWQEGFYQP